MGVKVKKSPKPAAPAKKKGQSAKPPPASEQVKDATEEGAPAVVPEPKDDTPKAVKSTENARRAPRLLAVVTDKCELHFDQVTQAVRAAFEASAISQKKASGTQLFGDDPEPIQLLVSGMKTQYTQLETIKVILPNPFITSESDVCLIVEDLGKGWKVDHEPTTAHYKELLAKNNVTCVNDIMPLRQLRVEYKPYEARKKLAKRYDAMLVDKRIAKFAPKYLSKPFYETGNLPIFVNLVKGNMKEEFEKALSSSILAMTNTGSCSRVQVGITNQSEKAVVENIMAAYEKLVRCYPGGFANIRSLSLRFGCQKWSVPIYASLASRHTIELPSVDAKVEPVIDDLSTLAPGYKVAVYPNGVVERVKDTEYIPGVLDGAINASKRKIDATEDGDSEDDEEEASDLGEESGTAVEGKGKKSQAQSKKKKKGDVESSEDEGDELEAEYMKELELENDEQEDDRDGEEEEKAQHVEKVVVSRPSKVPRDKGAGTKTTKKKALKKKTKKAAA